MAKSPTSCGISWKNIVTVVSIPILKSATYETPIERPSAKLWMKSPIKDMTAKPLYRRSFSLSRSLWLLWLLSPWSWVWPSPSQNLIVNLSMRKKLRMPTMINKLRYSYCSCGFGFPSIFEFKCGSVWKKTSPSRPPSANASIWCVRAFFICPFLIKSKFMV